MALKKKKKAKIVEPVVEETMEEQATNAYLNDEPIKVDEPVVDEVVIEPVDEIPEGAEIVDGVEIIPIEGTDDEIVIEHDSKEAEEIIDTIEEILKESDNHIMVGSRVKLIEMVDYLGREITDDPERVYTVSMIRGDKAVLKDKGLICGSARLSNLTIA